MIDHTAPRREILLVGSVGLRDTETVLRTVASSIADRIRRIPDGETGPRSTWSLWPRRVLANHPDFEVDPAEEATGGRVTSSVEGVRRWGEAAGGKKGAPPPPRMRLKKETDATAINLGAIGYTDEAKASYDVFCRLRDEGIIPNGVRFQVALPTTAAFLNAHIVYEQHELIEPVYRGALLREVRDICAAIPSSDLTIQWDVSTEMGQWEGVRHAHFRDVRQGVIERLRIHGDSVPSDAELGIHLCYGSYGNRHWKEPDDTANMVSVYNSLATGLSRRIDYVHMPVPVNRDDDAYYQPLKNLALRQGTKVFLGLIHDSDGVLGTRRRISVAQKYIDDFGIATECGFGRREPDAIPGLLKVHEEV